MMTQFIRFFRMLIIVLAIFFMPNFIYGNSVYDLSKLYQPSTQWLGIIWDNWEIDNDSTLSFCGHINPDSKVIAHLTESTASANKISNSDAENKYNEFGAAIDMSSVTPLGTSLSDPEHFFGICLKRILLQAQVILCTHTS